MGSKLGLLQAGIEPRPSRFISNATNTRSDIANLTATTEKPSPSHHLTLAGPTMARIHLPLITSAIVLESIYCCALCGLTYH